MNKIIGMVLIFIGINTSVFAQVQDTSFTLALGVASEFNSQYAFTTERFLHFVNNNLKITPLRSNIYLNIVFYKVEVVNDAVIKYSDKDCSEFILGILPSPTLHIIKLKGFKKTDYDELNEFLRENNYTKSEIRDVEIEGLNGKCLKIALKKVRANTTLKCLTPCSELKVFY